MVLRYFVWVMILNPLNPSLAKWDFPVKSLFSPLFKAVCLRIAKSLAKPVILAINLSGI